MEDREKRCGNCKHFSEHYIWNGRSFMAIGCGHCKKRKISGKEHARFPFIDGCELWEDNAAIVRERDESVVTLLRYTARQIENIALYVQRKNNPSDE